MSLSVEGKILLGALLLLMFAIGTFTSSRYVYRARWTWAKYRRHLLMWGTPTAAAVVLIALFGD